MRCWALLECGTTFIYQLPKHFNFVAGQQSPLSSFGRLLKDGELKIKSSADKNPKQRNTFLFDQALFMTKSERVRIYIYILQPILYRLSQLFLYRGLHVSRISWFLLDRCSLSCKEVEKPFVWLALAWNFCWVFKPKPMFVRSDGWLLLRSSRQGCLIWCNIKTLCRWTCGFPTWNELDCNVHYLVILYVEFTLILFFRNTVHHFILSIAKSVFFTYVTQIRSLFTGTANCICIPHIQSKSSSFNLNV